MSAKIIDGKAVAASLRTKVSYAVAALKRVYGLQPGLAVVLVGSDPASEVYVRNKGRQTLEVGMASFEHRLPDSTSQAELLALIDQLNADPSVHGILVQLPLPPQIRASAIIEAIRPDKDVDGFHPLNVGRVASGEDGVVPCTPYGAMLLVRAAIPQLAGREAVVIGRSNIVGKPMAQLLLAADCTVTLTHSRTHNLADVVRRADIVVAAAGRPEMVRGDWIKPGACVIDVGINRVEGGDGGARLVGDVAFAEAAETAGAITPVPGGVGPMTIACLLRNAVLAAAQQAGLPKPAGL
ncbi:MAG: bifunctional methylenetetrahydrofolate dehydrogenase/methenyltetrahydrofolate cyclohydrolase FolD [Betaproteobacteria bacterium]|nr:bifunctional methylenetetrahydrofolate dehydrogenase/methenyltetrahydrofolate cyclohydrolase FolD [Betaproteobacteria bacterium]